jgi:methylated-DNA-protein-cysteine methyltransferase-like protein
MPSAASASSHRKILAVVRRIPRGRVATYGQIATLAGFPRQPRLGGHALRHADDEVPWHRVVNARGELSPRAQSDSVHVQRARLVAEGVRFDDRGRVDLARFGWRPRTARVRGEE